jgi:hypothetical protein
MESPFITQTETRRFHCGQILSHSSKSLRFDYNKKYIDDETNDMTTEGMNNVLDVQSDMSFALKIHRAQCPVALIVELCVTNC